MSDDHTVSGGQPEGPGDPPPVIAGVETSVTAFIGRTPDGPAEDPVAITSFIEFERAFGEPDFSFPVTTAVRDFFQNGGSKALIVRLFKGEANEPLDLQSYLGDPSEGTGINALLKADIFNLVCIPPDVPGGDLPAEVYRAAMLFCADNGAMLLVDPPAAWSAGRTSAAAAAAAAAGLGSLGLEGSDARNAALYFPRVIETNPVTGQRATLVPCGIVAGIMARTDRAKGVWNAPAGSDADIRGIDQLEIALTDSDNELLNPIGINALRRFSSIGNVIWGARTMRGSNQTDDEYKYIPVRRLSLYIEESLKRGLQWAVFEPNDVNLWRRIRLAVETFLLELFRAGALVGSTPPQAFFVICDNTTTTPSDIENGIINVQVGFAPVRPAEFVEIRIHLIGTPPS